MPTSFDDGSISFNGSSGFDGTIDLTTSAVAVSSASTPSSVTSDASVSATSAASLSAATPPTISSSATVETLFDAGISFDGSSPFDSGAAPAGASAVAQEPTVGALSAIGAVAATSAALGLAPDSIENGSGLTINASSTAAATSVAVAPTSTTSSASATADSAIAPAVSPQPTVVDESNLSVVAVAAVAASAVDAPSVADQSQISADPAAAVSVALVPTAIITQADATVASGTAVSAAVSLPASVDNMATVSASAASASALAVGAAAKTFQDVGSTLVQPWTALVVNPDGVEYVINPIGDITINETFEKVTVTIDVPMNASGLPLVTDLVSDIILIRGKTKMYRMRVLDSDDVLTREEHNVRLTCCSYDEILRVGRIIYTDSEATGGQRDLAWNIIAATQTQQTLGITRYAVGAGISKTIRLKAGMSVAETINAFAASDDGFDWWIDADLKFHTQEPRRESLIDFEWTWGAEIAEMTRQSSVEQYVSAVYVTGSTTEVTIPGGSTYPPPAPAVREVATMPYGRWEKTFAYSDILTNGSLVKRADWHLGVGSRLRPTYTVSMEQGVWSPAVQIGGIVSIRAEAGPRLSFKVPARIEELTISVTSAGAEDVSMMLRAESEEINIGSVASAVVVAINTPPAGSTVIASAPPSGLSKTLARISPVNGLATVISSLAERIKRQEST